MDKTIKVSDLNPTSKKYIVWVVGFDYYAGGITGVHRWSSLKILKGIGWDSRPEAWQWCKEHQVKPYSVSSKDPSGKGAKCQEVRIVRIDKLIKALNDPESTWYERATCTLPSSGDIVL